MSKTMIDLLLEEVEEELNEDFSNFLEDYNVSLMLEQDQQNNQQQKNVVLDGKNRDIRSAKDKAVDGANNVKEKVANTANAARENMNTNIKGIKDRLNGIFTKADGFISNYVGKIEAGFKSLSQKIKGSETYKLANEISLEAIEFLSVPKQICRAGEDLGYVLGTVDKWTGGLIGNLKTRGNELKNSAQKGLKAKEEPTFLDKVLRHCNSIIAGLNNSMGSIGQSFNNIWASLKKTLSSGTKQEQVFLTLEEEVEYLLAEDDKRVFLTLDEEVDYLLS